MSGVLGVYSLDRKSIMDSLFYGLTALQHRGEEGCGVSVAKDKILTKKGPNLVYYFLKDEIPFLDAIEPYAGIGQTLYEEMKNIQPVEVAGNRFSLSLTMDGALLGFAEKHDEVIKTVFLEHLEETGDIFTAAEKLMDSLQGRGSYNLVIMVKGPEGLSLVCLRDPKGIKPLCLGKRDNEFMVASETKALDAVEASYLKDVEPGEVIVISKDGLASKKLKEEDHAHCAFEWVYFADPTSSIEGRNVYMVRKRLGQALAEKYPLSVDMVIASPDSGRGVALGYSQALGKPFEEAVIKNPGAKRTFQVEDPAERIKAARSKFYIIQEMINGKRVALGDDSIVRGTVVRDGMIYKLRKSGAKEVHLVISCPALCYPCFKDPQSKVYAAYGLHQMPADEVGRMVAKKLGADSVCYPSVEILEEAINHPGLCKACMDGKYPVDERFLGA
jgi:amidophosphoribosyltransferase